MERFEDNTLAGALIVDRPEGGPAENEEVMVIQAFEDALPPGRLVVDDDARPGWR